MCGGSPWDGAETQGGKKEAGQLGHLVSSRIGRQIARATVDARTEAASKADRSFGQEVSMTTRHTATEIYRNGVRPQETDE